MKIRTEENDSTPDPAKQSLVRLNPLKPRVWVDKELIPLVVALNAAGLKTRSHCSGHGGETAWIVVRSANVGRVEIRSEGAYQELLIEWRPSWVDPFKK